MSPGNPMHEQPLDLAFGKPPPIYSNGGMFEEGEEVTEEMMEPLNEIVLDYALPGKEKVQTYIFRHEHKYYINLEQLQSHGRIVNDERPICIGPDENNVTTLDLYFNDYPAYRMAKQWNVMKPLLVIEDPSCFEGRILDQSTSTFHLFLQIRALTILCRPEDMTFNEQPLHISIRAQHKRFGKHETETGTSVEFHHGSHKNIKKRDPRSFYLTQKYHGNLRRSQAGSPIDGIKNPLSKIIPGIKNPLSDHDGEGDPISKLKSVFKSAISDVEFFAQKLPEYGLKLSHELLQELEKLTNWEFHTGFHIKMHKNLNHKQRVDVTEGLHNVTTLIPTITFVDTWAKIDMAVNVGVNFEIYLELDNEDDVDVSFQMEVVLTVTSLVFCAVYLWPIPGVWDCVFGLSTGLGCGVWDMGKGNVGKGPDGQSIKDSRTGFQAKGQKKGSGLFGRHGLGLGGGIGLGLWTIIESTTEFNMTTPGFHFTVLGGSKAKWGWKNGKATHDAFDGHVDWKPPKYNVHQAAAKIHVGFGPMFSIDIMKGLSIGARIEMPQVAFGITDMHDVDRDCNPGGPFKRALQLAVTIRLGLYAGVTLFKFINFELPQFKTGIPGLEGLSYVFTPWKQYFDITHKVWAQWLWDVGTPLGFLKLPTNIIAAVNPKPRNDTNGTEDDAFPGSNTRLPYWGANTFPGDYDPTAALRTVFATDPRLFQPETIVMTVTGTTPSSGVEVSTGFGNSSTYDTSSAFSISTPEPESTGSTTSSDAETDDSTPSTSLEPPSSFSPSTESRPLKPTPRNPQLHPSPQTPKPKNPHLHPNPQKPKPTPPPPPPPPHPRAPCEP
ncbi:hypothetical protein EJ04DRAFT_577445 [Polyplosphaeria fusca]|uniref:Uncharacterized protein n=1 Tax=Polyplosphaeria fusca TaxID=682080 RepID=A0A9P4V2X2_9PLEO|nr:hypothetical protein EJ04DRAFT_577445 [Polyplosphaeria fusca]